MDDRLTVGIDVGGTKTAVVLMSDTEKMLATVTEPTERSGSPQRCVEHAEALIDRLFRETHYSRHLLGAVGVGLPGLIAPDGTFLDSIILRTWRDVDFHSLIQPRLGVPVAIENDTTMAALGHITSLPQHQRPGCLVCLTLGTGVGGAVLLDGVPMRGIDGTAGQVGHMIIDPVGRKCNCGSLGCLNAYASGTAITDRYVELRADNNMKKRTKVVAAEEVNLRRALSQGDPLAQRALDEATNALVVAVSSIVNILNPEIVVLGGGVASLGPALIDPIQTKVSQRSFPAPARRVRICQAAHGPLTGAIGAAVTAAALAAATHPDMPTSRITPSKENANDPG